MAVSKILIAGLIAASFFLTGVIGLLTPAGHNTADEFFSHDHHEDEDCGEHHHYYEFWNNDHHHHHNHHEEENHEECHEEFENEKGTV